MMNAATSQRIGLILALVAALTLLAMPASAQYWRRQKSSSSFAASFAYGGDDKGVRLELAQKQLVWDLGYFQDDDSNIYALELGWTGEENPDQKLPFALGAGYYYDDPDDTTVAADGRIGWWAGMGDFHGTEKGLFYQFRYIFNGPLEGTQGVFGYRL